MNKWLKIFIYTLGILWALISSLMMLFAEMIGGMSMKNEPVHFNLPPEAFILFLPAAIPMFIMELLVNYTSSIITLPFSLLIGFLIGKVVVALIIRFNK